MEILRFDESETPVPKRKRASKGWVALGLVATLMGVSTAFASSTVKINDNNTASLGQGVVQVVTCDNQVNVNPVALSVIADNETPTFRTKSIEISGIDQACNGNDFGIQVYEKYVGLRPDEQDDREDTKLVPCSYLGVSLSDSATINSAPGRLKCQVLTKTIWVDLGSSLSGTNNNASFPLDAPSGIEYLTLVSSPHSDSRF